MITVVTNPYALSCISSGIRSYWTTYASFEAFYQSTLLAGITDPNVIAAINGSFDANFIAQNIYNSSSSAAASQNTLEQLAKQGAIPDSITAGIGDMLGNFGEQANLIAQQVAAAQNAHPSLTTEAALNSLNLPYLPYNEFGTFVKNLAYMQLVISIAGTASEVYSSPDSSSTAILAADEIGTGAGISFLAGRLALGFFVAFAPLDIAIVGAAVTTAIAAGVFKNIWDANKSAMLASLESDKATLGLTLNQAIQSMEITAAGYVNDVMDSVDWRPFRSIVNTAENVSYAISPLASRAIGGFLSALWRTITPHNEPLVFDLGSGIQTTTLANGVHFDNQNNGFAERTAWVGANTGILVNDPSGGPITNGSQMFGTSTSLSGGGYAADGFSALADLDSNHDGVINSSDTAWSNFRIWVDANGNGVVDSGELETMAQAGISSINLTTTSSNMTDANGNYIGKSSTYSLVGGGTREVADVSFLTDPADSYANATVTLNGTIAALPNISGFGTVYDLQQAMQIQSNSGNTTLEGYVQTFASATDDATRNTLVDEIIYQWTGVENVSPTARGSYFDARQLEALEQFSGQSFVDPYIGGSNPGSQSVAALTAAYQQLHASVFANLESQTNLAGLFAEIQSDTDAQGNADWSFSAAETQLRSDLSANRATGLTILTDFNQALHAMNMDRGAGYAVFRTDLVSLGSDVSATFLNGTPIVNGTAGDDVIDAWAGNQTIIASQGGNDTLIGDGANETLYGSAAGDLFIGGAGNNETFWGGDNNQSSQGGITGTSDTFLAGQGTETFYEGAYGTVAATYAAGDGNLSLYAFRDNGFADTLILDSSITEANVSLGSPTLGYLTLTDGTGGDLITVSSNFGALEFADGISINLQGIGTIQHGSAATLTGAGANDFFVYSANDGHVTLTDTGGNNTLFIDSSINDSSLSYTASGNDLLITDGVTGDQITDKNRTVQTIEFADGTTSSLALAGTSFTLAAGTTSGTVLNDTYSYASGTGAVTISDSGTGNTLAFGSGISIGSLTFASSGNDLIITDGVVGDKVDILGQEGATPIITTATFSGGSTLSLSGLSLTEASGQTLLNGTGGNDTLVGSSGTEVLTGNGGNDVFIPGTGPTTAIGGTGNDTYSFASGDGHLSISESGGSNTIKLGSGISVASVSWTGSGNDLLITDGVGGDQIDIENQLSAALPVDFLVFANGTTENLEGIAITAGVGQTSLNGTPNDDTLTASSGTETLTGNGGNDTYIGSSGTVVMNVGTYGGNNTFIIGTGTATADGGAGNDTYSYASGDGHLTIVEAGGQNSIALASGLSLGNLSFAASGNDLLITDGVVGDQITVKNQLTANNQVQTLAFSGGSTISLEGLTLTETGGASSLEGSAGNDLLTATTGTQILSGNGGNDTYVASTGPTTAIGGTGNDTYSFASGDGHLTIEDTAGVNAIILGSGISVGAVSFTASGHDLLITDGVGGDQIDITNQLNTNLGITNLVFTTGGTTESLEGLSLTMPGGASILYGTEGNDTLTATAGTQTLYGNGGNDSFIASTGTDILNGGSGNNVFIAGTASTAVVTANGGTGNDIYSFSSGDGKFTIADTGGTDTLKLGSGLTSSNVSFSESGIGYDLLIADGTVGDQIDIQDFNYASWAQIEKLVYGDGTSLNLTTGGLAITVNGGTGYGTAGNDTLTATTGSQNLYGNGGNDKFVGSSGTERMYAGFDTGADTFVGGTSAETMTGNNGNDVFIAGTATTALISALGGTGNDIYSFSSGDGKLTIADNGGTDTLKLGTGLTASTTTLSESANGLDLLITDSTAGEQINIHSFNYASWAQVETLVYGDGTSANLVTGNLTYYATAGNTTLYGSTGNDTYIFATSASGTQSVLANGGNDIYSYNSGDGHVYISDAGGTDTLKLGAGITSASLTYGESANGADLLITDGTAGDQVEIYGYVNNAANRLETILFNDGSTLNLSSVVLTAAAGHSTLNGTAGNDVLVGTAGTQVLNGNGGSDTFIAGTGTETLNGLTGNDTYSYNAGAGIVSIYDTGGTDTLKLGTSLTASNISYSETGTGYDLLVADGTVGDQIDLTYFNYASWAQIEKLVFGDGSSINPTTAGLAITVNGATGYGTAGSDTLTATSGSQVLNGNGGNDVFIGGSGNDDMTAQYQTGNDTFKGGTGTETMIGDNGSGVFIAGTATTASITAEGGTGNDIYSFASGSGHFTVVESGGTNSLKLGLGLTASTVSFSESATGVDLLLTDGTSGDLITLQNQEQGSSWLQEQSLYYGDGTSVSLLSGNFSITAAGGTATLTGTKGNDILVDGGGTDRLVGNSTAGNDTFVISNASDTVIETNAGTAALVSSSVSWTLGTNFEQLTLTGAAALTGTGNTSTNILTSNTGADTLIGKSTGGSDTFVVNNTSDSITETNAGTAALVSSSVSWTLGTNLEKLTLTGTAALTGTGNTGNDVLTGNTGADTLTGNSSTGADTFVISNASDSLTETNSGTAALVSASANWTLGTHFEKLTMTGSSSLSGTGNTAANNITGNTGNDVLGDGGAGGSDTIIGNSTAGADTFIVNNAGDSLTETNSGTAALVSSSVSWTLGTNFEQLTLTGTAALTGTGNLGNDILTSNTGADTLIGKATSGNDTFVVNNTSDSLTETNAGTAALVSSSVNWTLGTNFEQLTLTGASALTGTGNTGNDILTSNTGADTLIGKATSGNDTFVVNNTSDSLTETNAGTAALVSSSVNWTLGASHFENLTLTGTSALTGTGNTGNDILTSNTGTDTLIGNSTTGADTFVVNNTGDSLTETNAGTAALVSSSVNYTLGASHFEKLTMTGSANLSGTGNTAANTITGNTGNDVLSDGGAGGSDTIIGNSTAGADTFVVNNTGDSLTETNSGTAALVSSSVNWTLGATHFEQLALTGSTALIGTGNTGNDILISNTGTDTLIGNSTAGADTFVVNNTGDSLTETNTGTAALVSSSVSWTLGASHFEGLTLTGTAALVGTGNSSNDVLTSNTGADTLIGNSTAGADTFVVNNTGDSLTETNSGTAAVISSSVNWTLNTPHVENLTLTGSSTLSGTGDTSANTLIGNTGNDVLSDGGAGGNDTIIGNSASGADTFVVNNAGDSLTETNSGTAALVSSGINWTLGATHFENLTLTGSSSLSGTGNTAANIITGNTGNDVLSDGGAGGNDTIIGNSTAGADTFVVNNTGDSLTETNSGTAALVSSSVNYTLGNTHIETLTLTGSANLSGTGNAASTIIGNTGNDILSDGGTGHSDTLIGNSTLGADTFVVNNTSDSLTETNAGASMVSSSVNWALGTNLENLTLTGSGNITGTGNIVANTIIGNSGNDVLGDGGAGGADTLIGKSTSGADTFIVNNANDSLTEAYSGTAALVSSSVSWTLGALHFEELTLTGSAALTGTGNTANNVLTSNTGADTLIGNTTGTGDTFVVNNTADSLTEVNSFTSALVSSSVNWELGGSHFAALTLTGTNALSARGNTNNCLLVSNTAADYLIGGSSGAADTFVVNNTADIVYEYGSTANSSLVSSSVNWTLGNSSNLTMIGSSNLTGTGNTASNTIIGNTGNDILSDGGGGTDTIKGNSAAGADTFVVNNISDSLTEANSGTAALVSSSVSWTLGTHFEDLTLTGTAALTGTGNTGNDILASNTGADTLVGNSTAGADTFVVNNTGDSLTETNSGTAALVSSSVNWTLGPSHFENLTLTGSSNLSGTGNTAANIITGNTGNDVLSDGGAGGSDTIIGNSASGADTFMVNNTGDSLTETNSGTAALVSSSVSYTLGAHIEGLTLTGTAALTGTGNTGNDILTSNTGADTLIGNSASGADTFVVNNASDSLTETNAGTSALVSSNASWTLGAHFEQLTLTGTAALTGTGNTSNDILTSNTGADTLIGNSTAGADTFVVNNASDSLTETNSGTAALVSSGVSWTLGASHFENLTLTGASALTGTGNTGNDILTSNTGADTLVGNSSTGADTFVVNNTGDSLTETNSGTAALVSSSVNWTLGTHFEKLTMTGSGNLSGTGNTAANTIIGNTGNDVLSDGGAGGSDTITGNSASGADTFVVNNTGDTLTETNAGTAATVSSSVSWTLGTHFEDLILTGASALAGTGNTGNDILTSNTGVDTLIGNSSTGADTFVVNNASDSLTEANSGTAALVSSSVSWTLGASHFENLTLTGTSALTGTGNTGNDILTSNTGADTLIGNSTAGADTFVVNNASDSLTETNSGTAALVSSSVSWTLGASHFENLTLTGASALTGTGNTGNDILTSNTGADTLIGNSTAGADTFVVNNTGDSLTETNSGTAALVSSSVSWTLGASHFEKLTMTGSGNLSGTGNTAANTIIGNTGNDVLSDGGAGGSDTITGNSASGADTFIVNNAGDVLAETNAGTAAAVSSSVSWTLGATHFEDLTLTGTAALTGTGNVSNDILTSNTGIDTLIGNSAFGADTFVVNNASDSVTETNSGLAAMVSSSVSWTLGTHFEKLALTGSSALTGTGNTSDDILISNTGADTLVGNSTNGGDTFVINNASDSVTEANSGTAAVVSSSVNWTLGTNMENLTLTGSGNISGTGNSAANIITANTGNDTISGGGGADTLIAGSGADDFVFSNTWAYSNVDIIEGFSTAANDKVDIKSLMTAAGYSPGISQLYNFVQALNDGSGGCYLQVDQTGTGKSFQTIADIQGVTNVNVSTWVTNGTLLVS